MKTPVAPITVVPTAIHDPNAACCLPTWATSRCLSSSESVAVSLAPIIRCTASSSAAWA